MIIIIPIRRLIILIWIYQIICICSYYQNQFSFITLNKRKRQLSLKDSQQTITIIGINNLFLL